MDPSPRLPGREFTRPADFNAQLAGWMATASTRYRRRPEYVPADRIAGRRGRRLQFSGHAPGC
jgi:hypothetical protein